MTNNSPPCMFTLVKVTDLHSAAVWTTALIMCHWILYCNLSKYTYVWYLKGLLKKGVGIFYRAVLFLLKLHPPHTQFRPIYVTDAVIPQCLFCHVIASANDVCLHLLVPPLAMSCLLVQHNCMYCCINRWAYFQEKSTFCNIQKGRLAYFQG